MDNNTLLNSSLKYPQSLPGIDIDEGLLRINGKIDKYMRMLRLFKNMQPSCIYDIKQAINFNNITEAIRFVHTLKGVCGSIGANNLSQLAKNAQISLEEGKITNDIISELERELNLVCDSIDQFLEIIENQLNMINKSSF